MKTMLLYFSLAVIVFIIYKIGTLLYYRYYLNTKLKNGNLQTFKKILGGNCQYKTIHADAVKYKWIKGWFVVRAVFDERGNLLENDKPQYDVTKLITAFYFTKCTEAT